MEVPHNIENYRRELCQRCKTPCEHQNSVSFRHEGDSECPIGRWMAYQLFVRAGWIRLGDAVAAIAEPIAKISDRVLRTKIKGCSACAKRKDMLNHLIPYGQKFPHRV